MSLDEKIISPYATPTIKVEDIKQSIKELMGKEREKLNILMEAISEFALFESTGVWDSKKVFGNNKPNFKFIGDLVIEISKIADEVFGKGLI